MSAAVWEAPTSPADAKVSGTPSWRAVATGVLLLVVAMLGGAIALAVVDRHVPRTSLGDGLPWYFWLQNGTSAVIFVVPGWYLARTRPNVAFGWLALAAGTGHGLAAVGFQYAEAATLGGHHLSAAWVGAWFAAWGPVVELPVLAAIYALFPDAGRPRGALGILAVAATAVVSLGVLAGLVDPVLIESPTRASLAALSNPIAIHLAVIHHLDSVATFAPGMIAATAVVLLRWWRAGGELRRVLSWLAVAAIAAFVVAVPAVTLAGGIGVVAAQAVSIAEVAVITAAVLRHQVFEIVVVLNRTLVYLSLSVGVALVYLAVVAVVATFADRGPSSVIGAVAAALLVAPGRDRVQRGVNRFLYGQRDEPFTVITAVGQRLAESGSPEELLQGFVEEVARGLRVPYLDLVVDAGCERFGVGDACEHERFEVKYEGRLLGHLLVGRRTGEPEVSAGERRLLGQLAGHAAVAVANYALTVDLRRSRERIVTAREEERRRLRRDLHDGLGPQLTGVALGLDAAADALAPVAAQQAALLELLRTELGEAITDIRRLVHDLRPPSLDELGLVGAVEALVARVNRGDQLTVLLDVEGDVSDLPAAVEVAALRTVSEAVNNVVRHARARTCEVLLRQEATALHAEIRDDGVGLAGDAQSGVGTTSMRERADEIGGTCRIAAREPRGVIVELTFPLARP